MDLQADYGLRKNGEGKLGQCIMIQCFCEGLPPGHELGVEGCLREECPAPQQVKRGQWLVPGETAWISSFTLFENRMYFYHSGNHPGKGYWSRLKGGGSIPSLEVE
jgi:hypothetical protein